MDIVSKLGELLLKSIPTIVCLLIVWTAYRNIVQRKLQRVLAERYARTEGAIQEAQAQIAKAEARAGECEQRLQEARSQVYKMQEARRRHIMEKRGAALAQARQQAEELTRSARLDLAREVEEARGSLQQQAEVLADQIIHSILKPLAAAGGR